MEVKPLSLSGYEFKEPPTKSQLVNCLRDISGFLSRVGGALLADEAYAITDQPLATMLNAGVTLKASADQFDAGPNKEGLVHAMPAPPQMPRR